MNLVIYFEFDWFIKNITQLKLVYEYIYIKSLIIENKHEFRKTYEKDQYFILYIFS